MERTIVMDLSNIIEKDHLILDTPNCEIFLEENSLFGKKLSEVEKILILKTLEKTNFSRCKTAKILGITTKTLSNKIKIYKNYNLI
jgi:Nif-specific regulatory protein